MSFQVDKGSKLPPRIDSSSSITGESRSVVVLSASLGAPTLSPVLEKNFAKAEILAAGRTVRGLRIPHPPELKGRQACSSCVGVRGHPTSS